MTARASLLLASWLSNFHRLFWSIYFVIGIAVIGTLFGYIVTTLTALLSQLLSRFELTRKIGRRLGIIGEILWAMAIRLLLIAQPWVRCSTNFKPIPTFFDQFKTRRVMFVGNHRSNMDTFLLISYIPGLRGLAKKSLYNNWFFAPMMRTMGFVPVEKNNMNSFIEGVRSLQDKVFVHDRPVLMFPENSRRAKGMPSLDKFSASSFAVAKDSHALIVPIVIKNTDQMMGRGDLLVWPFKAVEIKQLPVVDPRLFADAFQLRDYVHEQIRVELG